MQVITVVMDSYPFGLAALFSFWATVVPWVWFGTFKQVALFYLRILSIPTEAYLRHRETKRFIKLVKQAAKTSRTIHYGNGQTFTPHHTYLLQTFGEAIE